VLAGEVSARLRREWRGALLWALRITLAASASYLVGILFFPGTQPLLAPLTAMLVVQVTPVSLLASGLDRVVAVVAGVSLAVAFAAVVPLEWWSLTILIFVSILLGQALRLRANLIEVAISGMLVLGVGALGVQSAAWQRIAETLVGAAVGVIANLLFPPRVPTADAGRAIEGLADALGRLLRRAADTLEELAREHQPVHPARAGRIGADGVDHDRERRPGPGVDQPGELAVGEHDLHAGRHPVAQAGHHREPGSVVPAVLVTDTDHHHHPDHSTHRPAAGTFGICRGELRPFRTASPRATLDP